MRAYMYMYTWSGLYLLSLPHWQQTANVRGPQPVVGAPYSHCYYRCNAAALAWYIRALAF